VTDYCQHRERGRNRERPMGYVVMDHAAQRNTDRRDCLHADCRIMGFSRWIHLPTDIIATSTGPQAVSRMLPMA
jgi:hypothetical protein